MAKTTKAQEQSLESIMWNCRNALRGTVGGNETNRDDEKANTCRNSCYRLYSVVPYQNPHRITEISAELLNVFIEKIDVSERKILQNGGAENVNS